jgi:glycosyltransferase involved in cell wall biosynthesis
MILADVSVIMPAFNNAGTIARALDSVAAQTLPPRQLVVVDDGSADGTAAAAEARRPYLGAIELLVVRQANQGAGAARNRALTAATSTFVAFLDADDEWLPDKIRISLDHLTDPEVLFVSHDVLVRDCDGREAVRDCARHFVWDGDPFLALSVRGFVGTSTVVARRQAVLDAGGFEPSLRAAQDHDLWLRLAERGRFMVFSGALMRYHINPGGITANVAQRRRCSYAVLRRHLPAMLARPGGWRAALLRGAILHVEAAAAFRQQGRPMAALGELFRIIPALALVLLRLATTRAGQ